MSGIDDATPRPGSPAEPAEPAEPLTLEGLGQRVRALEAWCTRLSAQVSALADFPPKRLPPPE
jgi:hypothetical protein